MDHFKRKDYKFMMGDVTLVDFEIAHVILLLDFVAEQTGLVNPFTKVSNLYSIAENVRNLPGVKEYMDAHEDRPWMAPDLCKFMN